MAIVRKAPGPKSFGAVSTHRPVTSYRPLTAARYRHPTWGYRVSKRLIDLVAVILATPLVLPVLLSAMALIKLESPGASVFFRQHRTGSNGERFTLYKLRTMVPNAEELKKELIKNNMLSWPDFKMENDPRITRIGRFLRKSSIDELPQLYNVLIGEMSLVGPRPTSFESKTYKGWHTERLDVKPGITGLWQVMGRGRIDFDERVRLDIRYAKERSLWLDLKLLVMTVPALLAGD
ncbi:MAG: sugar transferase [Geminicoccaceae bacterium]